MNYLIGQLEKMKNATHDAEGKRTGVNIQYKDPSKHLHLKEVVDKALLLRAEIACMLMNKFGYLYREDKTKPMFFYTKEKSLCPATNRLITMFARCHDTIYTANSDIDYLKLVVPYVFEPLECKNKVRTDAAQYQIMCGMGGIEFHDGLVPDDAFCQIHRYCFYQKKHLGEHYRASPNLRQYENYTDSELMQLFDCSLPWAIELIINTKYDFV